MNFEVPSKLGEVIAFNSKTYYGKVRVGDQDFEFMSPCFRSSSPQRFPREGEQVEVLFTNSKDPEILMLRELTHGGRIRHVKERIRILKRDKAILLQELKRLEAECKHSSLEKGKCVDCGAKT